MGIGGLQNAYDNMKASRKGVEHPILILSLFAYRAAQDMKRRFIETGEKPDEEEMRLLQSEIKVLMERAKTIQQEVGVADIAVPHGVAELFAYRLSDRTGVRVPEVRLFQEHPGIQSRNFYGRRLRVKSSIKDTLIKELPGCYVSSKVVPNSLPIYFLARKDKTVPPAIANTEHDARLWEFTLFVPGDNETHIKTTGKWKELFDKRCPLSRKFYKDFSKADEKRPEVQLAAKWDSPARLLIHAWRALLHCTYPHNSNVLVDLKGNLHVIDHERLVYSPAEADIHALAVFVRHSPELLDACRQVGRITEQDIADAFEGIPAHFWNVELSEEFSPIKCRARDPKTATDYFIARLRAWNAYFS